MSIYNSNAKSNVNIGAAANDGTGDPLRNAFEKISNNFFDLYTFLGNGTHLGNVSQANLGNVTIGNIILSGTLVTSGSSSGGGTTFAGNVTVGNVISTSGTFTSNVIAGNITSTGGTFTGNVSFANITISGNIVSGNIGPGVSFPSTGVTAGNYGNSTHYPSITIDSSGRITSANVAFQGGSGGGLTYSYKTSNSSISASQGFLTDTTGGSFTVTLPATPSVGNQIVVADAGNNWSTNPLYVGRNGSTINNLAEDLACDVTGTSVQLVYDGTTWEVYTQGGGTTGNVAASSASFTGNVTTGNVSGTRGYFTRITGILDEGSIGNAVGLPSSASFTGNVTTGNVSGTRGYFTRITGILDEGSIGNAVGLPSNAILGGAVTYLGAAIEKSNVQVLSVASTVTFNPYVQPILYYAVNSSSNSTVTVNFQGLSPLTTGNVLTATVLLTNNNVYNAYISAVQIESSAVTAGNIGGTVSVGETPVGNVLRWQGSAPTNGNTTVDVYTFSIFKNSANSYLVLASKSNFT